MMVPGTLIGLGCMVRDSKRFADSGDWGYAQFNYDAASDTFTPPCDILYRGTMPSAGSRAIRS